METTIQIPDKISEIATIIRNDWKKIYFGAVPYLKAMESIQSINDDYFEDCAADIVAYFLANAQTWRGETARAVKTKLNSLLKSNDNS